MEKMLIRFYVCMFRNNHGNHKIHFNHNLSRLLLREFKAMSKYFSHGGTKNTKIFSHCIYFAPANPQPSTFFPTLKPVNSKPSPMLSELQRKYLSLKNGLFQSHCLQQVYLHRHWIIRRLHQEF